MVFKFCPQRKLDDGSERRATFNHIGDINEMVNMAISPPLKTNNMKKAIAIHIIFLILYLLAFLYVTDGVDITPFGRFVNVLFLVFIQTCVAAFCDLNELYKNK